MNTGSSPVQKASVHGFRPAAKAATGMTGSGRVVQLTIWLALTLLTAPCLSACALTVGAEQARVCRLALPALNPDGARITVMRAAPAPEPRSLRLDYRVEGEDRPALDRHAVC